MGGALIAERGFEHIDEVDAHLVTWAEKALGGDAVTLGPPGDESAPSANLHLLEIRPRQAARGRTPVPHKLVLRYLVSAWSEPVGVAHRQLGALAFAVMEDDRMEFDAYVPTGIWRDLGVPPRAAFILGIELVRPRRTPSAPLVERPLEVVETALSTATGRVLTATGQPVPGVAVQASGAARRVLTGNDGRFVLTHAVPVDRPNRLSFVAKGRSCTIDITTSEGSDVPLDFQAFSLVLDFRYRD